MFFILASFKDPLIIFAFLIVIITVIVVGHYFSLEKKILRELKKSKVKPIQSIQENGYEKLIGKALHVAEPLSAPISGRACIYYQIIVEKRHKNSWSTLHSETRATDFFIEKNGEMAIVKTDQPETFRQVFLEKDHIKSSGFMNDATMRLENYLKKYGDKSTNILGLNKRLRYQEGIIGIGETITVKGIGQWKNLKAPIEGFSYSKILTLIGSKDKKLIITDSKKAIKDEK